MDASAGPSSSCTAADAADERAPTKPKKKVIKPLTKKKLEKHLADAENRGVLYFSRIPPFMKPNKLRNLLEGMGTEVLRVYLAPEDASARAGRVRAGGNKKKNFTEAWVEFDNKRRAKRIASTLNNTPIGGGNRDFYAHDLWNVKYLHRFKWAHLTEKIAYEARVRRDKMQAELSQAKKETSFYLQKVEQAKAIDAMEDRKRKRAAEASGGSGGDPAGPAATDQPPLRKKAKHAEGESAPSRSRVATEEEEDEGLRQVRRRFKQRKVVGQQAASATAVGDALLGSLLSR